MYIYYDVCNYNKCHTQLPCKDYELIDTDDDVVSYFNDRGERQCDL